ncbi:hypothetical protein [Aliarcobacter butzleri]|uniref:hypothetical protein n=1 Tax=Aliarcobacter butzleri TaxID=28197 RepID=UPI003AF90567
MNKKILVSLLFVIVVFSGCGTKNNIAKKEDYKILDEVSIIGSSSSGVTFSKYYTTPYKCKTMKEKYDKEILDLTPLKKLLEEKNIKIKYAEPTKRILNINIISYLSILDNDCQPKDISVRIELYDVEDISKNWNKENMKNYIKDIHSLQKNDKYLIYSKEFILDRYYNTFSSLNHSINGLLIIEDREKRDINKFYQEVIKDLEKVMKFPQ